MLGVYMHALHIKYVRRALCPCCVHALRTDMTVLLVLNLAMSITCKTSQETGAFHQHEQCVYVTLMQRYGHVWCLMFLHVLYVLCISDPWQTCANSSNSNNCSSNSEASACWAHLTCMPCEASTSMSAPWQAARDLLTS